MDDVEEPNAQAIAQNRAELRETLKTLEQNGSELTDLNNSGLAEACRDLSNRFSTTRKDSRSTAIDAKALSTIGSLGADQAGNLDKAGELYVHMLKKRFGLGNDKINWQQLSTSITEHGIYMHVPTVTFLACEVAAAAAPKPRKERKQKERAVVEKLQTAKTVSASELQETAEDKTQNARMLTLLETIQRVTKPNGRVNLFELILHPTSFSQTVENFFDLAFLVKDGRAAVLVADGAAFVQMGKPPETHDFEAGLIKHQNIIQLDYHTYQALVKRWCKGPPMLDRDTDGGEAEQRAPKAARVR